MRIGIFGTAEDTQTQALTRELALLGADSLVIESQALERGEPLSFDEGRAFYRRQPLEDIRAFFLRFRSASGQAEIHGAEP